jgi:type IV pilus assembly protein PilA
MFSSAIDRLNDRRDAGGDIGEDAGFTLIELMVVLLILAILLAIAIPTFLGVTKSANDRAAQSNVNTAFVNAKAAFQQNSQSYAVAATLVTSLISAEPSLSFIAGSTTGLTTAQAQSTVTVTSSGDGQAIVLAVLSKSTGNCWYLVDNTASEATSANPTVPWSTNTTTNVATSIPTAAGTYYGEWKNISGSVPTCNSGVAPTGTSGTNYQFQSTGGFPAL